MATTASTTSVQELYIAYFGRPADAAGLAFYADALDAGTTTVSAIATSFGASTEAATTVALTTSAYVSAVYLQAFGRAYVSATDGTFWTDAITNGDTTKELAMVQILNGATGTDATAVTNKVAVANTYTVAVTTDGKTYSGATAITAAKAVMSGVTATASTVTSGNTAAATAVTNLENAPEASGGTGTTFLLTTAVDNHTGGTGDDVFTADNTVAVQTSVADTLVGGAGLDTYNVYSAGATFAAAALTSVETMNIYDQDDTLDLSLLNYASVTAANFIRGAGGMTITIGTGVANLGMTDLVQGDGTLFTHAATDTSTTLNLNGVTGAHEIELNGTLLLTHVINTSGVASSFTVLDIDASTNTTINANAKLTTTLIATTVASGGVLTLTGSGNITVGILDVGFDTVTATAHTGGLTALIGATTDTVINLGSGNDVITASTENTLVTTDTLQVDAGGGTNTLILAATADISTVQEGSHYTNFDILQATTAFDFDNLAGLSGLTLTASNTIAYTNMTAAVAANILFTADNATSTTFTLKDATGTSDVVSIVNDHATAATDVTLIGISVVGVETVNVTNNNGAADGDAVFGFLANKADSVSALNFNGASDVTLIVAANTLDVAAVAVDASGLTGTGDFTLVSTSSLLSGSSVKGTANLDTIAIGTTNGTTYETFGGNDVFTGALAALVATGEDDTVISAGAGTADKITLSDTTLTLTDNHFTNMTGMEILVGTSTTGAFTVTTGTAFNTAFAGGATISTGTIAASVAASVNFQAGLANMDVTFTVDAVDMDGAAGGEDTTIVTGSGADTITFTGDSTYVGAAAGDGGTISVSSGSGIDTISITTGTILAQTNSQSVIVNAGTGADVITIVSVYADTVQSTALIVIDAGDSLTTARDTLTGADIATANLFGTGFDFTGTSTVGTLGTSNDFGTIATHNVTAGVVLFDDASTYAEELVINAANLADAVGYLNANSAALETFGFKYDSTGNGTADAFMIYNNNTTDSLIELVGVTAYDALVATAASAAGDLFIA